MHEAAIVQELITLARQKAPPGSLVLEVHVSVGRLTSAPFSRPGSPVLEEPRAAPSGAR